MVRGAPEITQWSNFQLVFAVAVRFNDPALTKEYVPAGGVVVPPTPGKTTTIALVAALLVVAGGICVTGVNIA